jgi:hypothetical protein
MSTASEGGVRPKGAVTPLQSLFSPPSASTGSDPMVPHGSQTYPSGSRPTNSIAWISLGPSGGRGPPPTYSPLYSGLPLTQNGSLLGLMIGPEGTLLTFELVSPAATAADPSARVASARSPTPSVSSSPGATARPACRWPTLPASFTAAPPPQQVEKLTTSPLAPSPPASHWPRQEGALLGLPWSLQPRLH